MRHQFFPVIIPWFRLGNVAGTICVFSRKAVNTTVPCRKCLCSLRQLYPDQKHTLDLFLERGAISRAQYDKSLGDLTRKMGITNPEDK